MRILRLGFVLGAAMIASVGAANADETVVKVGFSYSSAPHSWYDVKSGVNRGYMLDIIDAIAKDAGFTVQYTGSTHDGLLALMAAKQLDVVATVWSPTPTRLAVADFSTPVYTFPLAMLVKASEINTYKTWADLKGKTVSETGGFPAEAPVKAAGGTILTLSAVPDLLASVASGTADGAAMTLPTLAFYQQDGGLPAGTAISKSWVPDPAMTFTVGFAVRKDEADLLQKINTSLAKLIAEGTAKTLIDKYDLTWAPPTPYLNASATGASPPKASEGSATHG